MFKKINNSNSKIVSNFEFRHSNLKNDGYVILVAVLIMGAVALAAANSVLLLGLGSSRSSFAQQQGYQAQLAADACAEIGIAELDVNPDYGTEPIDPFTLGVGTCSIEINQPCTTDCIVRAKGDFGSISRKTKITAAVGAGGGGGGGTVGGGKFPTLANTPFTYSVSGSSGDKTITVKDNDSPVNQPANGTFQIAAVTTPIIYLKKTGSMTRNNRGNVGDVVNIDGEGFVTNAATTGCPLLVSQCANIRWNGVNSNPLVQCDTGTTGSFTNCAYTIPAAFYGEHQVSARDQGSALPLPSGSPARTSFNQTFFVEPKITATACTGTPKQTTITGTGFAANLDIFILWENADTGSTVDATTNNTGGFSATFILPVTGTHKLGARDIPTTSVPINYAKQLNDNDYLDMTYTCAF